jgi:ribosome-associated protein
MARKPTSTPAADPADASGLDATNRERVIRLARICEERRAEETLALDVRGLCGCADYFLITTADNRPQMRAVAGAMEEAMKEEGVRLLSKEGLEAGRWGLLDWGEIVAHVLDPEMRLFYQIEQLWGDAVSIDWSRQPGA